MSILSVYRRTGGGYVFSPEPMTAKQTRDYTELLVGIGIVESESFGPNLAAIVARQLAQSAYAVVSATMFDEAHGAGS